MAFVKVCTLDDVWEGEMEAFDVGDREVLIVHLPGGRVCATQTECPHQQGDLVDGELDGTILTCSVHLWQFDVSTYKGVNPSRSELACYPVKIEDDAVYVDIEGDSPKFAHS